MKTIFKYILSSLLLVFLVQSGISAQKAAIRRADLYYDSYLYNDAISRYELIGKKRRDAHVLRRMAESYRLTGEWADAEDTYAELEERYPNEMIAEDYLHYGEVLRMN